MLLMNNDARQRLMIIKLMIPDNNNNAYSHQSTTLLSPSPVLQLKASAFPFVDPAR